MIFIQDDQPIAITVLPSEELDDSSASSDESSDYDPPPFSPLSFCETSDDSSGSEDATIIKSPPPTVVGTVFSTPTAQPALATAHGGSQPVKTISVVGDNLDKAVNPR